MNFFAAASEEGVREAIDKLPNHDFGQANVTNILNTVYAFVGIVAVAFIIYGGIQYMTANGDLGKLTKAKNTIAFAVVGLIIVLLAAAITFFVTQAITEAK